MIINVFQEIIFLWTWIEESPSGCQEAIPKSSWEMVARTWAITVERVKGIEGNQKILSR